MAKNSDEATQLCCPSRKLHGMNSQACHWPFGFCQFGKYHGYGGGINYVIQLIELFLEGIKTCCKNEQKCQNYSLENKTRMVPLTRWGKKKCKAYLTFTVKDRKHE